MSNPSTVPEWLALLESRHPTEIDLGLDRVAAVWARMDRPQPAARVFMVAGTNGKGSTVSFIAAMLMALGYRCGSYTSPHLFRYNERVRIQGGMVSDQDLISAFEQVEAARGEISLTYFEFGTLAAFACMSWSKLDFAVLEIGLGGRLDAVNILDADCAVITPIGLDHQEYLGHDLESIAYEKAGIMRAGKPVICGDADPPQSLVEVAKSKGAVLQRLGREFSVAEYPSHVTWRKDARSVQLPRPSMAGLHQVNNMATAVAALSAVVPGALDHPDLLGQALKTVRMAGRLQPSAHCSRVWLDVGHNPHAARAVAAALQNLHSGPVVCVLGMLRDKDAKAVAAVLDTCVHAWYCAGLGGSRGRSGADLAREVIQVSGAERARDFPDVVSALTAALEDTARGGSVVVFGSFITVAEADTFLESL